jgi:hypothetical protein
VLNETDIKLDTFVHTTTGASKLLLILATSTLLATY